MNTPKETLAVILSGLEELSDHEVSVLNGAVQRDTDPSNKAGYEKVKDLFEKCTPEELKEAFAIALWRRLKDQTA